jgi:DNA-directed RNA polymerase specialized sigma24 family protein
VIIRRELLRLARGRVDFGEFARSTRPLWAAMARRMARRWGLPGSVELEDLEQEMLLTVHRVLPKWDRRRASVERYVLWQANYAAKRWLHSQRKALRLSDRSPSRAAVPESWLPPRAVRDEEKVLPTAEDVAMIRQALSRLPSEHRTALFRGARSGSRRGVKLAVARLKEELSG